MDMMTECSAFPANAVGDRATEVGAYIEHGANDLLWSS